MNYNRDNHYNLMDIIIEMIIVGLYVPLGNQDRGSSLNRIEDMVCMIMKMFDSTYDNEKETRPDLSSIEQKLHSHEVSIKQIKQQLCQLSSTLNPRYQGTLPSNTTKNLKNDGQCMTITTRGGN